MILSSTAAAVNGLFGSDLHPVFSELAAVIISQSAMFCGWSTLQEGMGVRMYLCALCDCEVAGRFAGLLVVLDPRDPLADALRTVRSGVLRVCEVEGRRLAAAPDLRAGEAVAAHGIDRGHLAHGTAACC